MNQDDMYRQNTAFLAQQAAEILNVRLPNEYMNSFSLNTEINDKSLIWSVGIAKPLKKVLKQQILTKIMKQHLTDNILWPAITCLIDRIKYETKKRRTNHIQFCFIERSYPYCSQIFTTDKSQIRATFMPGVWENEKTGEIDDFLEIACAIKFKRERRRCLGKRNLG